MSQDLIQQLLAQLSSQGLPEQAAKATDSEPNTVIDFAKNALPILFGGLEHNAQNPAGAQAITQALAEDHDGSIFGQLQSLMSNPQQFSGDKILSHIFGDKSQAVTHQLARQSNITEGSAQSLLQMLAPIVMGFLGQQQTNGNFTASNFAQYINNNAGGSTNLASLAMNFIDQDKDGSVVDDLFAFGKKFFG